MVGVRSGRARVPCCCGGCWVRTSPQQKTGAATPRGDPRHSEVELALKDPLALEVLYLLLHFRGPLVVEALFVRGKHGQEPQELARMYALLIRDIFEHGDRQLGVRSAGSPAALAVVAMWLVPRLLRMARCRQRKHRGRGIEPGNIAVSYVSGRLPFARPSRNDAVLPVSYACGRQISMHATRTFAASMT